MASTSSAPLPATIRPVPADLFGGVQYFINNDVDETTQQEGGARQHDEHSIPSSSQADDGNVRFRLDTVTHVLALSVDFAEYPQCREPTQPEQSPTPRGPLVVTVSTFVGYSAS
ncbi:zinc carboxypeptidase [Pseudozyma hubeiensis SY62]|uniref:Zinc carboxypeptidase n=1 Tax=Pseudozyma hubeiensis (strain SY62) TaxID=1305764 RepID=R9NWR5_PSEHS|nr:zinc carboxypeptidase [Pseudozyma hubeiensis SY62]GAC92922.1 zinc carboxypeptidase [Pseudozyma hubeiensis SY62]